MSAAPDESWVVASDRTEAALNPTRGDADTGYDPDSDPHAWPSCFRGLRVGRDHPPHPGEACADDPWWCSCGEPIPIVDPPCTHGYFLCADHVDRCPECVDEKADAHEDFERKYRLENRP